MGGPTVARGANYGSPIIIVGGIIYGAMFGPAGPLGAMFGPAGPPVP